MEEIFMAMWSQERAELDEIDAQHEHGWMWWMYAILLVVGMIFNQ